MRLGGGFKHRLVKAHVANQTNKSHVVFVLFVCFVVFQMNESG